MSVQMIIGDYPLSLSTAEYNKLSQTLNYRWVERARLNRKPALQYQGPGLRVLRFSGEIHVQSDAQLKQPQRMASEADKGAPLVVLASNNTLTATYHGRWVITELRFEDTDLLADGTPVTISFEITLKEYGDDA
ncbi:Uncharacterised protein [BD1-7 clade bacterium]|uniref:Phage tail protein n=1 Tax=BD1-7 clade bacterium TaxID=2029982 RepID=A0A5S9QVS9_9GAMM|nr:Uncharacterised protein [BD1-7 clade bacterium]CAA0122811.1 Uncharacterised protein [BD1-7 clade bacterium]